MAQCFCGCAPKVKVTQRPTNKGGHQPADPVAPLSRLRTHLEAEQASPETLKMVDDRSDEGVGYVKQFKAVLHDGAKPDMPYFSRWFKDANQLISWFKLSPEERQKHLPL